MIALDRFTGLDGPFHREFLVRKLFNVPSYSTPGCAHLQVIHFRYPPQMVSSVAVAATSSKVSGRSG